MDDGQARAGAKSTTAALLANLGIAIAKFVAWLFTGSASLLAEAVHSVADTTNQALLWFGRRRSRHAATGRHPFGFGRERYFWAFVVAVVLFSAGGLFALVEGEEKLRRPHELTSYPWSLGVLLLGLCLEGYSFRTAVKESRSRKDPSESWPHFVRRTSVPELAVVLLEDAGALTGLVLALTGTTLAEVTGNARFDAVGSVGIGILLALIAFTLAAEMKSMLIGEAADRRDVEAIHDAMTSDPALLEVRDLRTELLGPDDLLVVGTVSLRASSALDLEGSRRRIEDAIRDRVSAARLVYLRADVAEPAPSSTSGR
ncbi:MAG: cation diffusion facilitator family transporter [Ilumatobacteraceae bacterium]